MGIVAMTLHGRPRQLLRQWWLRKLLSDVDVDNQVDSLTWDGNY